MTLKSGARDNCASFACALRLLLGVRSGDQESRKTENREPNSTCRGSPEAPAARRSGWELDPDPNFRRTDCIGQSIVMG